jgi:hypothetical protein
MSTDLLAVERPARLSATPSGAAATDKAIVIESPELRLTLGANGIAESLVHKATGQECLIQGRHVPMFTLTEYRPYDEILQLAYPIKLTHYLVKSVRREGDQLIASFPMVGLEATIGLKITDSYIGFTMKGLAFKPFTNADAVTATPVDETLFIQLPVRKRENFGDWLNVVWDQEVAVNVLATDPYAKIDGQPCEDHYLLQAGTVDEVKTEEVGAALIVTSTKHLLDRIATVEEDFHLPRGVASRRSQECRLSYYELLKGGPKDIDRNIEYARQAGFRSVQIYHMTFAKTAGHFPWSDQYPNGMEDLKGVVRKISDAGMIPGVHMHYNKSHKKDAYVTPKPDPRLNLTRSFTLTAPIDATATSIPVAENPRRCTLDDERRLLRIQNEIISYEKYSTVLPYQFTGCQRGALGTHAEAHEEASRVGLLDVDTWPIWIRFNQTTDIQQEVAARWKKIYRDAGFKFVFFDGAEDVPPPYWFNTSWAQWLVYKELDPAPLFSEGAVRSHFSWHIMSRTNTFNVFRPEVMKSATRQFPAEEAARAALDFSRIDFGWIGYWAPDKKTIGTQPDMLEFTASRAAAWDCPWSLNGELDQFAAHPRTADNLAVLKRWEDARLQNWLTEAQRRSLRNLDQEHILLLNEAGNFELAPYAQVEKFAGGNPAGRAFLFERDRKVYAVYWHTFGQASLEVALPSAKVRLMKEIGRPQPINPRGNSLRLPLADRLFLECSGLSSSEVIAALENARIIS